MTREERREWRQKRLEERRSSRSLGNRPFQTVSARSKRGQVEQQRKGCGCTRSKG